MAGNIVFTPTELNFIQEHRVARFATVNSSGRPHVIPVCFAVDIDRLYSVLDEKPKRVPPLSLRRVRNIMSNPRVAVVIDRYDEDWTQLAYILIQGQATMLGPEDSEHSHALDLLRNRYPQYRRMHLQHQIVIRIIPDHVVAWGESMSTG